MDWTETDREPFPKWKVGLWVWRVDKKWRLRLYRPWRHERLVEITCEDFLWAIYTLGIGARWWKDVLNETPKTQGQEDGQDAKEMVQEN